MPSIDNDQKIVISKKELETLIAETVKDELRDLYGFSPAVVDFLRNLRKQDIEDINKSVEFRKKYDTTTGVLKWVFVTIITTTILLTTFWESVLKFKGFLGK